MPLEIATQVLIELSFEDLQNACKSDPSIGAICATDNFKLMYIDRDPERIQRVIDRAIEDGYPTTLFSWGMLALDRTVTIDEDIVMRFIEQFTYNTPIRWDYLLKFCDRFDLARTRLANTRALHIAMEKAPADVFERLCSDYGHYLNLATAVEDLAVALCTVENYEILLRYQPPSELTLAQIWKYTLSQKASDVIAKTIYTFEKFPELKVESWHLASAISRGYGDVVSYVMTNDHVLIQSKEDVEYLFESIFEKSTHPLEMAKLLMDKFNINFGQLNQSKLRWIVQKNERLMRYMITHPTIWNSIDHDMLVADKYMPDRVLLVLHDIYITNNRPELAEKLETHENLRDKGVKSKALLLAVASLGKPTVKLAIFHAQKIDLMTAQVAVRSATLRRDVDIFKSLIALKDVRLQNDMKIVLHQAISRVAENIATYIVSNGFVRNFDLSSEIRMARLLQMENLARLMEETMTIEPVDTKRKRILNKIGKTLD